MTVDEVRQNIESDGLTRITFHEQKDGSLFIQMDRLSHRAYCLINKVVLEDCPNPDGLLIHKLENLYETILKNTAYLLNFENEKEK